MFPPAIRRLTCQSPPLEVAAAWPAHCPLLMLHSGRVHPRWARWSILASSSVIYRFDRDGGSRWIGSPSPSTPLATIRFSHDPLRDVDAILAATKLEFGPSQSRASGDSDFSLPFHGGWIGYFSYDLGRLIEPRAQHHWPNKPSPDWPLIELAYCPDALVYDHLANRWTAVGELKSEISNLISAANNPKSKIQNPECHRFQLSALMPTIDPDQYMSMVDRTLQYIAAGDIFQANIAQRFTAGFSGSARALAIAALRQSQPWYGAYLELADEAVSHYRSETSHASRCLVSLSPELFLQTDPRTRCVITRPIKGTRPATTDVQELIDSEKDAAELHMIVDLMRNDLGRVCEFGTVQAPNSRRIETHPTVHQGVAEITGRLRPEVTIADLLRATFPGGSVTGAPKIRAMQIIDELEPVHRGPYCGGIGLISDCGAARLSIAIRTLMLESRRPDMAMPGRRSSSYEGALHYPAGAGIVADSLPLPEYHETLDKTAVLRGLCRLSPEPVMS